MFKLSLDENLRISQGNKICLNKKNDSSEINMISNDVFNSETIEDKLKHLDFEKGKIISDMIKKNDFVFAKNSFDVGNVTKYECSIPLLSDGYISKKPYM